MILLKEIAHLLSAPQRRGAMALAGLMLIGMLLETLGIGLVIPALALMTRSDLLASHPALASLLQPLAGASQTQLILLGLLGLVAVYAFKALYLADVARRQFGYLAQVQVELSQRLFAGYLRQPYAFHLQRNSAELIRNTISEVAVFVAGLTALLTLFAEACVVLGISTLLLAVEPVGALVVVCTLGVLGLAFYRFTRHRVLRWGQERHESDVHRTQAAMEGLGGVKDVKLLGREASILDKHRHHNARRARAERRQLVLQAMPRLLLEVLAVTGLAALVFIMIMRGKPLESLVPTIGVFAAAAFRLMPSFNRILGSLQSLRYVSPGIRTLFQETRLMHDAVPPARGAPLPFAHALSLERVSFRYPSSASLALSGVSLEIRRGASVGLIGESGAGKSTLVDIILGLFTPTSGVVRVDGTDIQANLRGWQDQIGYVPQSIFLADDTIRRNVAFGLADGEIDDGAVARAIRAAQLVPFIEELPRGLDTVVGERGVRLSGGQRQRIGIARALYHDPGVLVLDEATSSLDTATEREVMNTVRTLRGEKTLIIVAHRLSTVEQCDRLYRLTGGRLVDEGDAAAVLSKLATPAG